MNLSLWRRTGQIQTTMCPKRILDFIRPTLLFASYLQYPGHDFYKNQSLPNFNTSRKAF